MGYVYQQQSVWEACIMLDGAHYWDHEKNPKALTPAERVAGRGAVYLVVPGGGRLKYPQPPLHKRSAGGGGMVWPKRN